MRRIVLAAIFGAVTLIQAQPVTDWVGSWAAAQQIPEPRNSLPPDALRDATLRQIVHLSAGGHTLRVHLSNAFGTAPLHLTAVHIARPVSAFAAAIDPATDKELTFGGSAEVTIPAGAEFVSDPIEFGAPALSDLAISIHFDQPPASETGHPGSRATSWLARGDLVSAADLPQAMEIDHWYQISGVDVASSDGASIVAFGDSITDGAGATTNGNDRWPDVLARRLQNLPSSQNTAVLNAGIGGNHLLTDGLGPNALARFDRDVLARAGVRYLIVLEGVNDLGGLAQRGNASAGEHSTLVQQIIAAYGQIVIRAHAHGIETIGATILPYAGCDIYHPGPADEADRQAVNEWIRAPGHFDAVIDFDRLTRDPAHPDHLLATYDSGDHLHPSPAGYAAMAEAIPLSLFTRNSAPRIAFTFDDLPSHGTLPQGETRLEIATKVLAALREAGLPPVYGFVNGVRMEEDPASASVLEAWRAAGNPLGSHAWSHMNLNDHTAEDFETDVMRDEPVLKHWMDGQDWHWFRYPYLAEGDTPEKKAAIRAFLLAHGYKVAGVTMSFSDYLWNDLYARCKASGDAQGIAALATSYLAAAENSIAWYRSMSHTLYGRDIPYVLLMHIGAFDAEMLPRLLALYQSKGFHFITLPEAESDPFYREDTALQLPPGSDSLEQEMAARGLPLPGHPAFAPPPNVCQSR